jgi:transcriptional regulator with XRE-family HTH domain
MNTRGAMIKQAREALGLSQEYMAERCKISQQSYSNIERNVTANPPRRVLKVIEKELNIPFETLVLGGGWLEQTSESARVVAREYDQLPPEVQLQIMTLILRNKNCADEPISQRTAV